MRLYFLPQRTAYPNTQYETDLPFLRNLKKYLFYEIRGPENVRAQFKERLTSFKIEKQTDWSVLLADDIEKNYLDPSYSNDVEKKCYRIIVVRGDNSDIISSEEDGDVEKIKPFPVIYDSTPCYEYIIKRKNGVKREKEDIKKGPMFSILLSVEYVKSFRKHIMFYGFALAIISLIVGILNIIFLLIDAK